MRRADIFPAWQTPGCSTSAGNLRDATKEACRIVQQPYRRVEAPVLRIGLVDFAGCVVTCLHMLLSQCGHLVLIGTDAAERVTGRKLALPKT